MSSPNNPPLDENCPFRPGDIVTHTRWLANPINGTSLSRTVLLLREGIWVGEKWHWPSTSLVELDHKTNILHTPYFVIHNKPDYNTGIIPGYTLVAGPSLLFTGSDK